MNCWAVIVAAGRGERAGLGQNKVFYRFHGRTVLARCLDAFERSGRFDGAVLVISPDDEQKYASICQQEGPFTLVRSVVYGGETRRDSVFNGLLAIPDNAEIVAIHDAARPFVGQDVIDATIDSARMFGSGVISTDVVDTIKLLGPDGKVSTLDRNRVRSVQTPQTFCYPRILEAHRRAKSDGLSVTDDAALFEHYYGNVRLVSAPGAEVNRKLTTKYDFESLFGFSESDARIGHGYDAHRLVEGRKLVLCGVDIHHNRGLEGHSDADVAVHALMDALLGAQGLGDIGRHFPDYDEQYRGISSMILLSHVMDLIRKRGYRVGNADITIVAQRPRLEPYMSQMVQNIAGELSVEPDRVNIKATTTEHMGFEGEERGISAQAVVILYRDFLSESFNPGKS